MHRNRLAFCLAAAASSLVLGLAGSSRAEVIFDSGTPDPGFFGYIGYDIFPGQSVGVAFTPAQSYTLDDVGVWIMSNDWDNPGRKYTLSLVTDAALSAGPSVPNTSDVLESWSISTGAVGWFPVLDSVTSSNHPMLSAGTTYWLVADSQEPAMEDPVWVWGSVWDPIYSGQDEHNGQPWQAGYTQGSAPGALVHGTPVPEPISLAAFTLAAAMLGRRTRSAR